MKIKITFVTFKELIHWHLLHILEIMIRFVDCWIQEVI